MEVLFSRVLNMSLTGSIVIAVVLLARLFLKRAPKIYSYALWAVVLFRAIPHRKKCQIPSSVI